MNWSKTGLVNAKNNSFILVFGFSLLVFGWGVFLGWCFVHANTWLTFLHCCCFC